MPRSLVTILFVAAACSTAPEDPTPNPAPDPHLRDAVVELTRRSDVLFESVEALSALGDEPAPADAAAALDAIVSRDPEESRRELADALVTVVEAGLLFDLATTLADLGPEPSPAAAAAALDELLTSTR